MTEAHPVAELATAVKRQWWLVAVTVVAAIAVGYVVAAGAATTYTGTAELVINTSVITRPGIAKPDQMITEIQAAPRFRSLAASETGLPETDFASDVGAYTVGDPQSALFVTYTAKDRKTAERAAKGLARAAVTRFRQLSETEITKSRLQLEETKRIYELTSRTTFAPNELRSAAEGRLSKEQMLYNYRVSIINQEVGFDTINNVYTYDENVAVSDRPASEKLRNSLVGAGFIGFVLGIVLAAVRELLGRKGAATAAR